MATCAPAASASGNVVTAGTQATRQRGRLQRPHPARPGRDPGADRARHRDAQPEEVPHVERERLRRTTSRTAPPARRATAGSNSARPIAPPVPSSSTVAGRHPLRPARLRVVDHQRRPGPARSWPARRPGRPPWRRPRPPPGPAGSRDRRPRRAGARRRPPRAPPPTGSPRPYGPCRSAPPRPRTRATRGSRAARLTGATATAAYPPPAGPRCATTRLPDHGPGEVTTPATSRPGVVGSVGSGGPFCTPGPQRRVDEVHPAGVHLDPHLIGTGLRIRHVLVPEGVGAAELVLPDRLHVADRRTSTNVEVKGGRRAPSRPVIA